MSRVIVINCCIAMFYATSTHALTGFSIGAKVDMAEYSGDVLPESGNVGSVNRWGIIMGFGAIPMLDFELRASYLEKEMVYASTVGSVTVTGNYQFQDVAAIALLKKDLFAPPGSPAAFYLGLGGGVHYLNTEVANAVATGALTPEDDPLTAAQATAKPSFAAVAGLRLAPPMFPLAIFGEAAYEQIFATERVTAMMLSVGLQLRF